MHLIKKEINKKFFSFISLFIIISFCFGFFLKENSGGGGNYTGDFQHVWKNLQTFKNNSIKEAIDIMGDPKSNNLKNAEINKYFQGTRPPLIYIIQSFNPTIKNQKDFFWNTFLLSFFTFILFYFSHRQKHFYLNKKINLEDDFHTVNILPFLLLLSPYFRTSAYWAMEENYAIFSTVITSYFYIKFIKNNKNLLILSCLIFFSSLTIYFDQKFLIVPLLSFGMILKSSLKLNKKIYTILLYIFFSLPFIYLIKIWGNILPSYDATNRSIGSKINYENIIYSSSIISFYIFPFLNLKKISFNELFKFSLNKLNILLFVLFLSTLFYFLLFFDLRHEDTLGNGMFFKVSLILFDNFILRKIFLSFVFIVASLIIIKFINNNYLNLLFILYLLIVSIFVSPYFQEYLDPIILLILLLFLPKQIEITKKRVLFILIYFTFFLVCSNIYYFLKFNLYIT